MKAQEPNGSWGEKAGENGDIFVTQVGIKPIQSARSWRGTLSWTIALPRGRLSSSVGAVGSRKSASERAHAGRSPPERVATRPVCTHVGADRGISVILGMKSPSEKNTSTTPRVVWYEGGGLEGLERRPKTSRRHAERRLRDLLRLRRFRAARIDSWDRGDSQKRCGRVGAAATYVLTLEVYCHYLPLYKRNADGGAVGILEDK